MSRSNIKLDRKGAFIDAAEELFNEKGFENTSIDDIVERVGVAKGLFYYYFDSKEELLGQIMRRLVEDVRSSVRAVMKEEGLNAIDRLRKFGKANEAIKTRSVKLIAYFHKDRNKALHYCMEDQAMEFMVPAMELIIKQGVEEGFFDAPYPRETAIALLSSLKSVSHSHLYDGPNDRPTLEEVQWHIAKRLLGYDSVENPANMKPLDRPS